MKKSLIAAALLGVVSLANAQSWKVLPLFTDPAHKLQPTLALTVDNVKPDGASSATSTGLEFNFNCGLIQDPDNRIRTSLKLHRSKEDGLTATTFELSPRYTLPLGNGLSVGAGPSLASVRLTGAGPSRSLWGAGVAVGAEWRTGAMFVGADLRWHDMQKKNGVGYDHTSVGVRVGINF
jgi:Outer membrane protein beta-barrel domain